MNRRVKLIAKKEFTTAVLNLDYEVFVIYIAALNISSDTGDKMHLLWKAQIVYLKADKASIKVFCKYIDFINIFLSKLVMKLSKYTSINHHAIELVDDWQSFYGSIYSLSPMELEILKIYIENNLANSFIKSFKSLTKTPILFNW